MGTDGGTTPSEQLSIAAPNGPPIAGWCGPLVCGWSVPKWSSRPCF